MLRITLFGLRGCGASWELRGEQLEVEVGCLRERSTFGSFHPIGSSFKGEGRNQGVSICRLGKEQPETWRRSRA